MAKLKRNTIQLVVDPKAEEIKTQTFVTAHFIPFELVYECVDLIDEIEDEEKKMNPKDMVNKLMDMTVKIYDNQFTVKDLREKLHAPDGMTALKEQVMFITQGQQSEETKKYLAALK